MSCSLKGNFSLEALREHDVTLRGERIVLRPMTENGWDVLARWNSDPEVLWFSEGDDVQSYTLDDVQDIYRGVSQHAFCFMIEVEGKPVGECWIQEMNLDRILSRYPHRDCRRIDLTIGEKALWGKGYGTEKRIEGVMEQGEHVVLLEDVATTAGAALKAVEALREAGAGKVSVLLVLDRQEGAEEAFREADVPFRALFTSDSLGIKVGR